MRAHTKSRFGCQTCKHRRVKCDEGRPSCNRCLTVRRQCTYGVGVPSPYPTPSSAPSTAEPPAPAASPATPSSTHALAVQPFSDNPAEERYSLFHLELFDYLRGPLRTEWLQILPEMTASYLDLMFREAFKTPYLMDALLAFTAARKSADQDLAAITREACRGEATRLQTRALSHLNLENVAVTDENCVQLFFFSIILGQHAIFDAFSTISSSSISRPAPELSIFLDELVGCLTLQHGIASIAGRTKDRLFALMGEEMEGAGEASYMARAVGTPASVEDLKGTECDDLRQRLKGSDSHADLYQTAVNILQYLFDVSVNNHRQVIAVQEWLVRVPKGYVELLRQRRPEALVIVAYYGVLLHRARDHWAIGGSGAFLIRAITSHLGSYWEEWLARPNEMLCAYTA